MKQASTKKNGATLLNVCNNNLHALQINKWYLTGNTLAIRFVYNLKGDLPSELADLSASVWAAKAFVRSNSNSWNCFDSDESTDRRELKYKYSI